MLSFTLVMALQNDFLYTAHTCIQYSKRSSSVGDMCLRSVALVDQHWMNLNVIWDFGDSGTHLWRASTVATK
jgi:hypothetical protein